MPLTPLQKEILTVLSSNRTEESHFAGGVVLNAGEDSPRFSHDFDIFRSGFTKVKRTFADAVSRGASRAGNLRLPE
jgi:hypothetical protein